MRVFLFFFMLYASFAMKAQSQFEAEKFEGALLRAKYGAMLVYNGEKNSFTLKFVSKTVDPAGKPNFVKVDDFLIQASISPFQQELDFNNLDEETQKRWLLGWKTYEKNWIDEQLKMKVKEQQQFLKIGDRIFLQWTFNMPESNATGAVVKQVYFITICFDQIMVLNAPLEKDKSETVLLEKLKNIAGTLELHAGQVQDLKKLTADLLK
jgi:hypothetical protein